MDESRFFERIDKIDNIEILSMLICDKYNIGKYIASKIVEIGYEDFNLIINTSSGKLFAKIFRNSRNDVEVENVAKRAYIAGKSGIRSPKVLENIEQNIITYINYNNSRFRLILMEYVEGKNFFELNRKATLEELTDIADLAASFSKVDYKPEFIYDSWAIPNFIKEFDKKRNYISKEYIKIITEIYNEFKTINYQNLPKSFTHGDISLMNVIKDKNDKLWVVDYSVSNFGVRLNEIVVSSSNYGIIEGKKEESENRIRYMFERWAKNVNASDVEKIAFKKLFRVQNAIYIMNPLYEIARGNNSAENKKNFEIGKLGLTLDVNMK